MPLSVVFAVSAYSSGVCTPLDGAQVDVWHADGVGLYSDEKRVLGTSTEGEDFLRGWQRTDRDGVARFETIYPGWYPGRAVHIHVKVRLFDSSRNATTEATTQLFFDDRITDEVYASNAPYHARGPRTTRNADDGFYGHRTELLFDLSGSPISGYAARIALGVQVGSVSAD